MQVILTSKTSIDSAKGQFVIYRGISDDGSTIEAFLTKEQAETFEVPNAAIASKAQIAELFKELPVVDVEFNQRGRVVAIKA